METKPIPNNLRRDAGAAGFTLPSILVVVGALLILAVGVLLVVGIERNTARAFSDRQRAELAAQAALEDIRGLLNVEAANDEYLVIQSTLENPITTGAQPAPHLFLARATPSGATGYSYRYRPLFSTLKFPSTNSIIAPPDLSTLVGTTEDITYKDFETLPYQDKVRAAWLPVKDDKNRTIARYAFWVEDLQSRIDPAIAGNEDGTGGVHARAAWPFPAPGLNPTDEAENEKTLDQIAVFAVEPQASDEDQGEVGKMLVKNRNLLISPDSLLAAAGLKPPLSRLAAEDASSGGKIGDLQDIKARSVEKSLSSGIRPYKEQPLIPFSDGIDPSVAGEPKLNLNKLLAAGGSSAVDEMADFIAKALPSFEERKGGFPDDYLKTLAANTIDYADTNSASTMGNDYRGVDAYPLVSEFLMRFHWKDIQSEGGRKYMTIEVTTYSELWNMSDQAISGKAQFTHDTRYTFDGGVTGSVSLGDVSTVLPKLEESDGSHWYPARDVDLKANEYLLINWGTAVYKIDVGPDSIFIPSNGLKFDGESYGQSGAGYKLKWNGQIIDQARGSIHRNSCSPPLKGEKVVRCSIPSMSGKVGLSNADFRDNMGDVRMSYYNSAPQDASKFPHNYSPNRRNIRYEIYRGNTGSPYGRVMPSDWPDGGHNSTADTTFATQTNAGMDPEAPIFKPANSSLLRKPEVDEAPFRLSRKLSTEPQRFYSATELGRVYDPIMWKTAPPPAANLPWGDVETGSTSDQQYGGGNTLRIGRPEHPMFDKPTKPGMEAYRLLDLFHAGLSRSSAAADREGSLIEIDGHVNLNTASRDALRAIVYGRLTMDPKIAKRPVETHDMTAMRPRVTGYTMPTAEVDAEANRITDAIIATRKIKPFTSPSGIAEVRNDANKLVIGNKNLITDGSKIHRTDSAAEELFARLYEASTVRSRNFRIWVIGQAVAPTVSTTIAPEVLSEVRKVYTVFADPGERASDGSINPANARLTVIHENDF
jgi:type II secretory pathway pseudopilin PulG